MLEFQSTLPRGERRGRRGHRLRGLQFQSTLPRGERLRVMRPGIFQVSFNPRSRAGSDATWRRTARCALKFQSTLPRGERHSVPPIRGVSVKVSIHAPARGATGPSCRCSRIRRVSIHAPARGATVTVSVTVQGFRQFQSTLPRGERRRAPGSRPRWDWFQSTLPRGERPGLAGGVMCFD